MPVPTAWRLIWASPRAGGELVGFLLNKAVLTWSGIWSAETCYAEADFHASTYQWRTFSFSLLLLLSRLCQHQQKKVVWHGRQYGYGISRLGLASVRGRLSMGVPPEESHEPDASASVGHWQACIQYLEEKRWGQHPCRPQCGRQRVARKQDGKRSGRWNCHGCKSSFNVLSGTIVERTMAMPKWFLAVGCPQGHPGRVPRCRNRFTVAIWRRSESRNDTLFDGSGTQGPGKQIIPFGVQRPSSSLPVSILDKQIREPWNISPATMDTLQATHQPKTNRSV